MIVVRWIFCRLNRSRANVDWLSVRRLMSDLISPYEESNGFLFDIIGWIVTKWPHFEYFIFGIKCMSIWKNHIINLRIHCLNWHISISEILYEFGLLELIKSFNLTKQLQLTLIVVRSFSLVTSMNARQSSDSAVLKTPFVALSMTISIPSNVLWSFWLRFSKSSLFKISQWRTEIPADCDEMKSVCATPFWASLPFTNITWQLCFEESCSASSFERFVSPFVIFSMKQKRKSNQNERRKSKKFEKLNGKWCQSTKLNNLPTP